MTFLPVSHSHMYWVFLPVEFPVHKLSGRVVSCRELASQLRDEVVEQAKQHGLKLYLVSIGPKERGIEFAEHLHFPKDQLLADPENAVYDALSLTNSVFDTFFNPKVLISNAYQCT